MAVVCVSCEQENPDVEKTDFAVMRTEALLDGALAVASGARA
jgi:hypothetical protein